jgi:hypothetical protein
MSNTRYLVHLGETPAIFRRCSAVCNQSVDTLPLTPALIRRARENNMQRWKMLTIQWFFQGGPSPLEPAPGCSSRNRLPEPASVNSI